MPEDGQTMPEIVEEGIVWCLPQSREQFEEALSRADGIAALLNDGITHVFIDADAANALWRDDYKPVMTQIYWATWLIRLPERQND